MAPFHRLLSESSEMLNTVKPLSLYLLYAATTFGFSARQGPHQLAQKSISTYLPRKEESETDFPLVSGRVNSGALPVPVFFFQSFTELLSGKRSDNLLTMATVSD